MTQKRKQIWRGTEELTMTNADKIRSMTDEELAEWLDEYDDQWYFCHDRCPYFDGMDCTKSAQSCIEGRLEWLKQEAEK